MSVADLVSPRVLALALCCALTTAGLAGCGGETEAQVDAGAIARRDAGSRLDAGIEPDAGILEHDAGIEPDAGILEHDAGLEPDAGLSVCGDGVCASDEDCGSCADDCTCPVIEFTFPAWEETTSAPLVAGGHAKVRYDLERLTTCRSTHNGYPGWSMTLFYTHDLAVTALEAPLAMSGQPFEPVIDIPAGATQLITWIKNADVSDCEAWDSNLDANYVFPVSAP